MNEKDTKELIKQEYGITAEKVNQDELNKVFHEHEGELTKINAATGLIPEILHDMYKDRQYTGAYRVVYEKGIGVLQNSKKHPGMLHANLVKNGKITGQAELEEITPDTLMQLSNITLAAFRVASIATNQYFLSRIDTKLDSIEKTVDDIKKFLSLDKQAELISENAYLIHLMDNIEYVEQDDAYRQSALIKVQDIRVNAGANIYFYKSKLLDGQSKLSSKDKIPVAEEKLKMLKEDFSELWFSTILYGLSSYLEARLSQVTDSKYLDKIRQEIVDSVNIYEDCYEMHNANFKSYIGELKALTPNQLGIVTSTLGGFVAGLLFGVAGIATSVGIAAYNDFDRKSKNEKKELLFNMLENFLRPYSNYNDLDLSVNAVDMLDNIYNKKVELIISERETYLLTDDSEKAGQQYHKALGIQNDICLMH